MLHALLADMYAHRFFRLCNVSRLCVRNCFCRLRNVSCLCGQNCFRRLRNISISRALLLLPAMNVLCLCGRNCFRRLRNVLCLHGQICFARYAMSHDVSRCLVKSLQPASLLVPSMAMSCASGTSFAGDQTTI